MKDGNEKSEWTSQTFAGAVGAEILILASHLKVDLENPEWEVKIALMGEEVVILGERSDLMSVNPLNAIEVDPAKVAAAVIAGAPTGGGVTFAVQCKRFEKSLRDFQSTESPEARTGIIRRADGIEVSRAEIDEGGDIVLEENKPLHEQKWWTDPLSGGNILWVFLLWLFVMWSLLQSKGLPFTDPRFGGVEMSLCCGLNFAMVLYVFKIYERIANRSLHRYQVEIKALKNEEE
jgi:hypothetical protein